MIIFKNKLKEIVKEILKLLPEKDIVIFESAPDLSDNTKPVFDEFISRGINKRFKLIWLCFDKKKSKYPDLQNVEYVYPENRIRHVLLRYIAKTIVCCNRFIGGDKKNQTVVYLTHGSPLKDVSSYYRCPDYIDYVITDCKYMNAKVAFAAKIDESKCYPLGFPRNDIFTKPTISLSNLLGDFKKYVIWYPTVKQFSNGRDYGIKPISFLDNDNNVDVLNEYAQKNNVLIVIKPHFAQVKNIKVENRSNIKFISDDFYKENNLIPYQFLGSCDALISDYSSVIYDFMLCNKPIGLVWNDIEDFKRNVGLFDFYEETTAGCNKIYTFEDLCSFVKMVSDGRDELKSVRESVSRMIDAPKDGKSASRVTDFIIEKAKMKI